MKMSKDWCYVVPPLIHIHLYMYIYFCHALKYDLCQIYIHYLQLKGQSEAPFSFAPPPAEQFPWLIDCLKLKSNSETLPLWAHLWELVCFLMQIFQFSHVFYLKASPWPWQVLWILCLNGAVYNCLVLPTGYNNYLRWNEVDTRWKEL